MEVTNPIREIILSIHFAESIPLNHMENFIGTTEIKEKFPYRTRGYNANIQSGTDGNPPAATMHQEGFILKGEDKIMHPRLGQLSLHKINGYQTFPELLAELNSYWKLFQEHAGKLTVTKVALRYVNFIDFSIDEDVASYLNVNLETPFHNINSSFVQFVFEPDPDQSVQAVVVVTKAQSSLDKGIMFDIILNKFIDQVFFEDIGEAFENMRDIKNALFQQLITSKTKEKYHL